VPELELRSKYELFGGGKILLFPFEARGNNWIEISNFIINPKHGITKLDNFFCSWFNWNCKAANDSNTS
jgi:hypothetical protein